MSLAQLKHTAYFRSIRFQAKPTIETLIVEYKLPKSPNRQRQEIKCVWSSYDPSLFKIGCTYFNIQDFLHIAKTKGYWGKYPELCHYENKKTCKKYKISIEDFERIVDWISNIHEKHYFLNI